MLFGGSGMIMGHENTHGFDNQGRNYDGTGRLVDWWTPESAAQFNERVQCVINQYSQYEVLPGVYVNGNLTQGENLAGTYAHGRALYHLQHHTKYHRHHGD
jgi:putative endopeptidase